VSFTILPAFCQVTATFAPTTDSDIKIEVRMPAENCNGKLVGIGNGIWAGDSSDTDTTEPVGFGSAAAATGAGHVGTGMDAKFAVGYSEKLLDVGYRAVHEMTVKAEAVTVSCCGGKARRSPWVSCSTGGGKLLLSHGWSDGLIRAANTAAFYKAMTAKMDPKTAASAVRLFMVPGMGHCGRGDAPVVMNILAVIDEWTGKGKALNRIIARRSANEKPMSWPLGSYPQAAKYTGTGDTDDAAKFVRKP